MLLPARQRTAVLFARLHSVHPLRYYTNDNPNPANNPQPKPVPPTVSHTKVLPSSAAGAHDPALYESPAEAETKRQMQAPNRKDTWSRSQKPRSQAMVGPRFEQAIIEDQPRPLSAMELIHKQPVRWTDKRSVSCDGGGGPLGHPRIFINVDKPQICFCTYCGVPFAHQHHRKLLESQTSNSYPLDPTGDSAEVPVSQGITGEAFEHR